MHNHKLRVVKMVGEEVYHRQCLIYLYSILFIICQKMFSLQVCRYCFGFFWANRNTDVSSHFSRLVFKSLKYVGGNCIWAFGWSLNGGSVVQFPTFAVSMLTPQLHKPIRLSSESWQSTNGKGCITDIHKKCKVQITYCMLYIHISLFFETVFKRWCIRLHYKN